jgi:hypothetical protein
LLLTGRGSSVLLTPDQGGARGRDEERRHQ